MTRVLIRDCKEADFQTIVAINAAEVQHTSPMDLARFQQLHMLSHYCKVVEVESRICAFLLAMGNSCSYQNDNFRWFASRYHRFLYIDRIVVSSRYTGLKIGTNLYRDLFAFAISENISTIACEYNIDPPNEPSRRFHDSLGFSEVGNQWLNQGAKKVSLQTRKL